MYANLIDEGYACLRRSDPETALHYFRRAAEYDERRPQAHFAMAVAYLELPESGENVVVELETALNLDPSYVPARAYLGIERLKHYDIEGARIGKGPLRWSNELARLHQVCRILLPYGLLSKE